MLSELIKTEKEIWFTYEDAKSAVKFFTNKIKPKPKFEANQDAMSRMSALVNTDYVLLKYLQNLVPEGVDDKGHYYWSCPHAPFESKNKIYDIAGWQLSIILFLRQRQRFAEYKNRKN